MQNWGVYKSGPFQNQPSLAIQKLAACGSAPCRPFRQPLLGSPLSIWWAGLIISGQVMCFLGLTQWMMA